jgi:hypothetical protein
MSSRRFAVAAEAVTSLRRHLWLRRGTMALMLIVAALFFVSRTGPIEASHVASGVAIFVIFCAGGARAIKLQVDRLAKFELWLDADTIRFINIDGERQEFRRSDIASVEERGVGLEIRRTSQPTFVLIVPRQVEGYEELRRQLGGR